MSALRSLLILIVAFATPLVAVAQAAPIVGILEGKASVIRQTTRLALAEGVTLADQDIVETGPGSFVQVELPGGVVLGLGETTRLMLRPKVAKGMPETPFFLLEGWLKLTAPGTLAYLAPSFQLESKAATTVVLLRGEAYEVFVESGTARLAAREGGGAPLALGAGDFAQRQPGAAPVAGRRVSAAFVDKLPRPFRDKLPTRAEQLARRSPAPKPIGEIAYADAAPWLATEKPFRQQFLPLWRGRCQDKDFRAEAKANLSRHPEWEPHADPEGWARKLAEAAERRREREAARQAAQEAAQEAARAASAAGATN